MDLNKLMNRIKLRYIINKGKKEAKEKVENWKEVKRKNKRRKDQRRRKKFIAGENILQEKS